jgi:hypothetical protein
MAQRKTREPHPPAIEEPDELEPGQLPVEPDEVMVPTHIPEDEERGRLVDPEDREPSKARGGKSSGPWHCSRPLAGSAGLRPG